MEPDASTIPTIGHSEAFVARSLTSREWDGAVDLSVDIMDILCEFRFGGEEIKLKGNWFSFKQLFTQGSYGRRL